MLQWIVIVFTAMPPNVPPKVQYIPVPSESGCTDAIDRWTPIFEAEEGLIFRFDCRRIKFIEKESKTEGEEDATVNE
jgi:hypothetical protein